MNSHHTMIDPSELPIGMTDIADEKLYLEAEYDLDGDDIYVSKIYILFGGEWHEIEWTDEPLIDRICQEIHDRRTTPLIEVLYDIAGGLH